MAGSGEAIDTDVTVQTIVISGYRLWGSNKHRHNGSDDSYKWVQALGKQCTQM
jgi:hypothetical protein